MSDRLYRGDNAVLNVAVIAAGGGAYDITGKALRWTAKNSYSEPDSAGVVKTTAGTIQVTNAAGGLAKIPITPADLEELYAEPALFSKVVWDLQIAVGSANYTIARGEFYVDADVGRSPA
jgi:hypothetical protein